MITPEAFALAYDRIVAMRDDAEAERNCSKDWRGEQPFLRERLYGRSQAFSQALAVLEEADAAEDITPNLLEACRAFLSALDGVVTTGDLLGRWQALWSACRLAEAAIAKATPA